MRMFFDVDNERTRAEIAKYDGVNLACSACLSEDTVETSELIPSGRNYRIRCPEGHVSNGIPPTKFRAPFAGITDPTGILLPYIPQDTPNTPWFIRAAEQWEDVAETLGYHVNESTFDYTTVCDDADDDTAVEAVRIGEHWYMLHTANNQILAYYVGTREEIHP